MSDFGDEAQERQERLLRRALAEIGIHAREVEIPPPHFEAAAVCGICGARIAAGDLCAQCAHQLDKGGR